MLPDTRVISHDMRKIEKQEAVPVENIKTPAIRFQQHCKIQRLCLELLHQQIKFLHQLKIKGLNDGAFIWVVIA